MVTWHFGTHWREDVPESEGLISCSCYYCRSIWACCQVQDSVGMASQCCHLSHVRIGPDVYLVLGVSMSAHYLMKWFAELQVANLWTCILWTYDLTCKYVSHFYHTVCCSSSCCQQAMLMWWPGYSLNCSLVITKFINGLSVQVPYYYFIVIATWC